MIRSWSASRQTGGGEGRGNGRDRRRGLLGHHEQAGDAKRRRREGRRGSRVFPEIRPVDYETAVRHALEKLQAGEVETTWTDALVTSQGSVAPVLLTTHEGMILEQRQVAVDASPDAVFDSFARLGGRDGWLYWDWAWRLRGMLDRLVGGVGLSRGRRDPVEVRPGDALDFWRVEAVEPNHLLRLRAEMKVPGRAWLQFKVVDLHFQTGNSTLMAPAFCPKVRPSLG